MQKQNLTDQVPDSDGTLESLETRVMFITQADPKNPNQIQDHCDDMSESLQLQEMFATQRERKLKDEVSDSEVLFESAEEMLVPLRTQKNRKNRRLPTKPCRKKLFWAKVKELEQKKKVVDSQTSYTTETRKDAQLTSASTLPVPTHGQQIFNTQTFSVPFCRPEASGNDSHNLVPPIVTDVEKKEDHNKNTDSKNVTATASCQTDLTSEHMQSHEFINSCMDCEYMLLTAETLMLLVRIIYDKYKFRNRSLSSDESMPEKSQESEKKIADGSSQMRCSSVNTRTPFLKEIRSLKKHLDNNYRNKDEGMNDSGYLDEEDTDASTNYHPEIDAESYSKSDTDQNVETKKRCFKDGKAKKRKKRKKEMETEKSGKLQKKSKGQTSNESFVWKLPLDIPVEILPSPYELKQLKKKKLLGATTSASKVTNESKKLRKQRKKSKSVRGDALSSFELESCQEVDVLKKELLEKQRKTPKKKTEHQERVKGGHQQLPKTCCDLLHIKDKCERRKVQDRKQRFSNNKRSTGKDKG